MSNGTTTLEVALRALNLQKGAEVITSPRSYVASVNSIIMAGLKPKFVDIDRDTGNLSLNEILKSLSNRTECILIPHIGGLPFDISALKSKIPSRIKIVEDCAQAHGAQSSGYFVGQLSDFASFSFCNDKIISTGGEGGMLLCNDIDLFKRAWAIKDHGKDFDKTFETTNSLGCFRYIHDQVGTNARLTEMQSAIGILQLSKLEKWLKKRKEIADAIYKILKDDKRIDNSWFIASQKTKCSYYRFYFKMKSFNNIGYENKKELISNLNQNGVQIQEGSCSEIYNEQSMKSFNQKPLPVASEWAKKSMCFQTHHRLKIDDAETNAKKFLEMLG